MPIFKDRLKFDMGVSYLRPSSSRLDYAFTGSSGDYSFNSLNPAFHDWGYEFGIGYNLPCSGNDVQLRFHHLAQDESAFNEGGGFLISTLTNYSLLPNIQDLITVVPVSQAPSTTIAVGPVLNPFIPDFIQGVAIFRQDRLDLELGQSIMLTPDLRLRIYTGLRGAKLDTLFASTIGLSRHNDNPIIHLAGIANPYPLNLQIPFDEQIRFRNLDIDFNDEIKQRSKYIGLGPRLGLEANYYVDVGISIIASMATALLTGDQMSSLVERSNFTFTGEIEDIQFFSRDPSLILIPTLTPGTRVNDNTTITRPTQQLRSIRVVPNLESKIGITYSPCLPCTRSKIFLEAGYLANYYFNAANRFSATQPAIHLQTLNLCFDGFYLKFEMHV